MIADVLMLLDLRRVGSAREDEVVFPGWDAIFAAITAVFAFNVGELVRRTIYEAGSF